MPRLIEIVLFLTPFLGFAVWRLAFPTPLPPSWLIGGLAGFVVLMLLALVWLRHIDASDTNLTYVPAELRDGRVVPAHPAAPP
ncbi:MAG: DUF6111 family protein [Rhodopila sp.]|nr:DUF6111 family protein [Rhodopila sp.]